MAVYFVASGGSNTSPYDTWAKAATLLETALAAATSDGDIVVIQYDAIPSADAELSADKTWTVAGNVSVIAASNDGGSDYTPTEMTTTWIGNSTTNRGITIAGGYTAYFYGLRFRLHGSTADDFVAGASAGADYTFEACRFINGNTNSGSDLQFGGNSATVEGMCHLIGCTFRFGNSGQRLKVGTSQILMEGCSLDYSGSVPTSLFEAVGSAKVRAVGCNFYGGTNLADVQTSGHLSIVCEHCRLPSTLAPAQTTYNNRSQVEVIASDSFDGDVHYQFLYFNNLGTMSVAVGGSEPYITSDGTEVDGSGTKATWKIVTSANASFANPFRTPWIARYNETLSALSPYLEALRKGSATAFKESELWSEWAYKNQTTTPSVTIDLTDRGGVKASTTDQASSSLGAGDWTNEDGSSNAYHKLAPSSTLTPVNTGDISVRVCVAAPSVTVYIDPQIRGL